jgi:hypothetical protein
MVRGSSNVETVVANKLLGNLSWFTEVRTKRGWDAGGVERADMGLVLSQLLTVLNSKQCDLRSLTQGRSNELEARRVSLHTSSLIIMKTKRLLTVECLAAEAVLFHQLI